MCVILLQDVHVFCPVSIPVALPRPPVGINSSGSFPSQSFFP